MVHTRTHLSSVLMILLLRADILFKSLLATIPVINPPPNVTAPGTLRLEISIGQALKVTLIRVYKFVDSI
jgi:hypothetical protein